MLSEPAQLRAAMAYTSYIAHAASTLTVQGRLETRGLPPTLRGGLLAVEDAGGAVTPWQKVLHALQCPFKALAWEK